MSRNWLIVGLCSMALIFVCSGHAAAQQSTSIEPVTVAFIGDQGINVNARAVLHLIKAEGADIVLHQGDLDYDNNPKRWDAFISEILGSDFAYLASVGNHDEFWYSDSGYQARLQARVDRIEDLNCGGDLGVQSVCSFRGLFFILSGIGTRIPADDPVHIAYIRAQLAAASSIWRICSWHKNQKLMQVGNKQDEVGWASFEACREGGAIIATAHEHSYSRTHLLEHFQTQRIASTANRLVIEQGRSFAFVSGLGGKGIRRQHRYDEPWWASVYTSNQNASYGALFCTFFDAGRTNHASCRFKDISGRQHDQFELISQVKSPQ